MAVAIVTGSNKGIGFAVVKALCEQFNGDVFLTARNEELGKKAVAELEKLGLHPKFHQLDINDEASIVTFKEFLLDNYSQGIDILVNNAGMAFKHDATDPFGVQAEETTQVNFLGTLNVCEELFPLLKEHARVVNVSSSAGWLGRINGKEPEAAALRKQFADPNLMYKELIHLVRSFVQCAKQGTHVDNGWPTSAYMVSKVAVSAMTRIQQREFDEKHAGKDLVINHVHPGYVDTDMTSHKGPLTVEAGSVAIVWAALLPPMVEKPRGDYIWHDKQIVDWVNGPLPAQY